MIFAAGDNFGLSFLLEVVALILVGAFIAKYVAPYLKKAMDAKAESIRAQLNAGEEAKVASAELVATRKQELDEAKVASQKIIEQSQRTAEQLVADGKLRAQAEYERIVARASIEIDLELSRVRDEVMAESANLILDIAYRVVIAELDDTLQHQLVESGISAVEAQAETVSAMTKTELSRHA